VTKSLPTAICSLKNQDQTILQSNQNFTQISCLTSKRKTKPDDSSR